MRMNSRGISFRRTFIEYSAIRGIICYSPHQNLAFLKIKLYFKIKTSGKD
jgi:hypothetical protein